jgi:hypothetical protein
MSRVAVLRVRFAKVQDVDSLREPGYVADPMLRLRIDAYLPHTGADGRHWLPVARFHALLHAQELEARNPSSFGWKGPDVSAGRPEPEQRLVHRLQVHNYQHGPVKA